MRGAFTAAHQTLTEGEQCLCAHTRRQCAAYRASHVLPSLRIVPQMIMSSAHSIVVPTGEILCSIAVIGSQIEFSDSLQIPNGPLRRAEVSTPHPVPTQR